MPSYLQNKNLKNSQLPSYLLNKNFKNPNSEPAESKPKSQYLNTASLHSTSTTLVHNTNPKKPSSTWATRVRSGPSKHNRKLSPNHTIQMSTVQGIKNFWLTLVKSLLRMSRKICGRRKWSGCKIKRRTRTRRKCKGKRVKMSTRTWKRR